MWDRPLELQSEGWALVWNPSCVSADTRLKAAVGTQKGDIGRTVRIKRRLESPSCHFETRFQNKRIAPWGISGDKLAPIAQGSGPTMPSAIWEIVCTQSRTSFSPQTFFWQTFAIFAMISTNNFHVFHPIIWWQGHEGGAKEKEHTPHRPGAGAGAAGTSSGGPARRGTRGRCRPAPRRRPPRGAAAARRAPPGRPP